MLDAHGGHSNDLNYPKFSADQFWETWATDDTWATDNNSPLFLKVHGVHEWVQMVTKHAMW